MMEGKLEAGAARQATLERQLKDLHARMDSERLSRGRSAGREPSAGEDAWLFCDQTGFFATGAATGTRQHSARAREQPGPAAAALAPAGRLNSGGHARSQAGLPPLQLEQEPLEVVGGDGPLPGKKKLGDLAPLVNTPTGGAGTAPKPPQAPAPRLGWTGSAPSLRQGTAPPVFRGGRSEGGSGQPSPASAPSTSARGVGRARSHERAMHKTASQ